MGNFDVAKAHAARRWMQKMSALNLFPGGTQNTHNMHIHGNFWTMVLGKSLQRWAVGEGESISSFSTHNNGRMIHTRFSLRGIFLVFLF